MIKKRIALITVWFPPNNGVAVNRMNAFANYLGDTYDVEVFTLGDEDKTETRAFGTVHFIATKKIWEKIKHQSSDGKLLHKSKTALNIVLTRLKISSFKSWKKAAIREVLKRQQESPFDCVISSFSPVEPHEVAYMLKDRYPNVKWIADMRDEMSSNPFMGSAEKKKFRKMEVRFEEKIDAITTISDPILQDFKKIMPKVKEFVEVRNGFDHDIQVEHNFNDLFTIVYAGTFYGKRKPDHFFQAILQLIKEGKIGNDFKFQFIGTNKNFHIPHELVPHVEFIPKVPYLKAMDFMVKADCNLLINPPLGTKGQFSGKIFDYISIEKPILALLDKEDVAAQLIEDHNAGVSTDFFDINEIAEGILVIYNHWKRREHFPVRKEKTHELHRKFQVEKLKLLIEKIDEK